MSTTVRATHEPPGCGCILFAGVFLIVMLAIHPVAFFAAVSLVALLGAE